MIKLKMRHLQALHVLASTNSFTEAASQLHTTQSNLSLTIKEAEALLGVKLFERTTRRCQLTSTGKEFLPVVDRVLLELQKGIGNMQANVQLTQGVLAIGSSSLTMAVLVADLLTRFRQDYPGIAIRIEDHGIPVQLLKLLRSESLELLIGTYSELEADLVRRPLIDVPFMLYAHKKLGLPEQISWKELKNIPTVAVARGSVVRQLINKVYWDVHGTRYAPILECNHWTAVLALTEAQHAACIIPIDSTYTSRYQELERKTLLDPAVSRTLYLAYLKHRTLSPAAQAFIAQLQQDPRFLC